MPYLIRAMWMCVGFLLLVLGAIFVPHAHTDIEIPALYYSVILLVILLPLSLISTVVWRLRLRFRRPLPPFRPRLPGKRDEKSRHS
jgi:NhaP-type Na+/H+ and K+/H+ antiporter